MATKLQFRTTNVQNSVKSCILKIYLSTNNRITYHSYVIVGERVVYSTKGLKLWVQLPSILHFSVGKIMLDEDRRLLETRLWISFEFF